MIDRHVRAISRVNSYNKNGLVRIKTCMCTSPYLQTKKQLLKDLDIFCELLCTLNERVTASPQEYIPLLCCLVQLCGKPFLKQKISDENTFTSQVLQTLALLGQLALTGNDTVTVAVAKAIAAFHSEEPNRAFIEGYFLKNGCG